ncbi:MAG: hypothetical protein ASARMPREDX12_004618 [Alectoria sarmentosa]|nr:MAG: hypothetical protein ASARMPREDX12_004618 [Alectoria sarmentosa]
MSCCALREKEGEASNEQKWDYINLSDFRSTSCLTPLSYGILYLFLVISIAVYAVDLFTCANLLIFDRWSGQVKPAIPFHISRWMKAVRAIKSGVIAASYLDPLAVRVQSIRMGANGRGWRRFLVFAALTKGRKGNEYVALFTYFSFEAWLRICFAEGPRVAINALTLYSVMQADLVPTGQHSASDGHTPVVQFFVNVQILANKDKEQAAILFGMLFTLIIWVISALSLALAVLFYILYLWHHIRDGSLSRYCRRKIDTRLHKIVMKKVNKALAKDSNTRAKQGAKGPKDGAFQADVKLHPTLPVLDTPGTDNFATLSRQTTQMETSSIDPHTSIDVIGREPTVPNLFLNPRRPEPTARLVTQSSVRSNGSYESNAPLLGSASEMGYGGNGQPGPKGAPSRMDSEVRTLHSTRPPPNRSFTGSSQSTQRSFNSSSSTFGRPNRQNSDISGRITPAFVLSQPQTLKPMPRDMAFTTVGRHPSGPQGFPQEFEMHPPVNGAIGPPRNGGYLAFNPHTQSASSGLPVSVYPTPSSAAPPLNSTLPPRPLNEYFGSIDRPAQRSGTAPLPQATTFNTSPDDPYAGNWQQSFARPVAPSRPATAIPNAGYGQRRPVPPRY